MIRAWVNSLDPQRFCLLRHETMGTPVMSNLKEVPPNLDRVVNLYNDLDHNYSNPETDLKKKYLFFDRGFVK